MGKGLFITGTGTEVGKTYVTALIIKKLKEAGKSATYYKAAVSGNEKGEHGLIPGDAQYVREIAKLDGDLQDMVPYVYEAAVSPHLAARMEGHPVELETVKAYYQKASDTYDYVTMEGSGGILCPIRLDEQELWLEDMIQSLHLPSLIVADAGLGTINSVVLTVEYMKKKGLAVKGVLLNHYHPGNVMEEDNIRMIEHRTGIHVLACVKDGDTDLAIKAEQLAALYE